MPILWCFPRKPPAGSRPLFHSPAVDAASRYYLTMQDRVLAFEPNGEIRWNHRCGGPIPGPPSVGSDGRVRVHSADGLLHSIDSTTGTAVWNPVQVGPPLGRAAPLIDATNTTWISSAGGDLLRVSAQGLRTAWFRLNTPCNSAGIVTDEVIYLAGEDGHVRAISTQGSQGQNRWDSDAGHGRTGWYINFALARRPDGLLVVASADDRLYFFTPDGVQRTVVAFEPAFQITSAPVVDEEGSVYLAGWVNDTSRKQRAYLFCLDGKTFRRRWAYPAPDRIEVAALLGNDGEILVGDRGGIVHTIDRNGKRTCVERVPSPVRSAGTLLSPGRVGFGLEDGGFVVLSSPMQSLASGWPKYLGSPQQTGRSPTRHGNGSSA